MPAALITPAQALPTSLSPDNPLVAEQWANPMARAGGPTTEDGSPLVSLDIVKTPTISAAELEPGQPLTVVFSVSNNSDEHISDLSLVARRAESAPTVGEARRLLSLDDSAYQYYGNTLDLPDSLAPGEQQEVTLSVPADPNETGTLSLLPGSVYPVMFSLSGRVDNDTFMGGQQLSTERTLISVAEPTSEPTSEPAPELISEADQVPGLSLIYPLTAQVDIVPGETGTAPEEPPLILASEQLAQQLAPGGRLDQLLSAYRDATDTGENAEKLQEGSCLAIDPALVDTVSRMSQGYTVAASRPSLVKKSQRLRDSWTAEEDVDPGVPGTGAEDASRWITELSQAPADSCIIALPWGNADLNAIANTGDEWLFREAVQRGPATLESILGIKPQGNIVIPDGGYVTEAAAPALGWADQTTSTIPDSGMANTWETSTAGLKPQQSSPPGLSADDSSLEATDLPTNSTNISEPASPVHVLVADNTVWQAPRTDRFARLAPGITAVTYHGALGALLASTGPAPQTVGYSNPVARFDYRLDSSAARTVSAGAALRLGIDEGTIPGTWDEETEPLMVVPPAHIDTDTAEMLLSVATDLFAQDHANPLPIDQAISPSPQQQEELDAQPIPPVDSSSTRFGSPYADPAVYSDSEALRAGQQARYIDDLTRLTINDPGIALTRYGFTLPLRRDVLLALTATNRNSIGTYDNAVNRTDRVLNNNRETLQDLRASVALIPPGNVYTRVSESSPLLIVAENRLPLPVDAELAYSGPDGAFINVPDMVHIPAHGSITVQMTTDLPTSREQTKLNLWLSTPDGSPVSDAVEITVQTRTGIVGTYGIGLLLIVGLSLALLFRVGRQRHQRHRDNRDVPKAEEHSQNG